MFNFSGLFKKKIQEKSFAEQCQDNEIALGNEFGINTSVYNDKRLSPTQMKQAREALQVGSTPSSISFLINKLIRSEISENDFDKLCGESVYISDIDYFKERYRVLDKPVKEKRTFDYPASFYGAAFGDIAGSRFEFGTGGISRDQINCDNCINDKSRITDDTILSIATREALKETIQYSDAALSIEDFSINNTFPYQVNPFTEAYRKYGVKYPDAGFGSAFYHWLQIDSNLPYGSLGNGSAMRVSPIVDKFDDIDDIIASASASSSATHNHVEGIKGAVVTAVAGWMAKTGYSRDQIVEYMLKYYQPKYTIPYIRGNMYLRDFTMDELKHKVGPTICPFSVPASAICLKYSNSYEDVINNVLSFDGDTDTIGAIAGTIAGPLYGVPEKFRRIVNDRLNRYNLTIS